LEAALRHHWGSKTAWVGGDLIIVNKSEVFIEFVLDADAPECSRDDECDHTCPTRRVVEELYREGADPPEWWVPDDQYIGGIGWDILKKILFYYGRVVRKYVDGIDWREGRDLFIEAPVSRTRFNDQVPTPFIYTINCFYTFGGCIGVRIEFVQPVAHYVLYNIP